MAVPTTDQLRENLCSRDPRNPYFADLYGDGKDPDNDPGPAAAPGCACNNCFYGRTPMADNLLQLRELLGVRQAWDDWPVQIDHPGRAHPLYPGGAYDSGVWQRLHTLREAIREAAALPPHPALDAEFTSPGEPPCAS